MSFRNIPDEVIHAVLQHHDIIDVVSQYVHLTKHGRNYKGLCPFHSEKTPSFTVSTEKQIFHCFGCGTGGNVIKFLMEIEGHSFPEAVAYLAEEANIPLQWKSDHTAPQSELQKKKNLLIEAHELSARWFHYILKNSDIGSSAMKYLKSRGFSDKLIDTFQIGYAPPMWDTLTQFLKKKQFDLSLMESGGLLSSRSDGKEYIDRFRDRIMFPIRDSKGKVIAFAGRVLQDGEQPKYLNTPDTILFKKSRTLYNLHQAKATIRKTKTVVLFEGYADVIKAWQAGIVNGVAAMGTAFTDEHAAILKRYADQVIICYDGDHAGQAAALNSLSILERARCHVKVVVLDETDPDEYIEKYGPDSFRQMVDSAISATEFRLHDLKKKHSLQTDDGRLQYIQAALKLIATLHSPTEREHYLKQLSSEYGYSLDTLKQEMHQIREKLQKMKKSRDNKEIPWNNVMNESKATVVSPTLLPAYYNAERHLLAMMMQSREITTLVEQEIGDQFNVEMHAVLAAYLYAYYTQYHEPEISKFMATLQDEKLESAASAISMLDIRHHQQPEVIQDYIRTIKQRYMHQNQIEAMKQEKTRAERAGDVLRAAEIAKQIITLERQMKSR